MTDQPDATPHALPSTGTALLAALISTFTSSFAWIFISQVVAVFGVLNSAAAQRLIASTILLLMLLLQGQRLPTWREIRPHLPALLGTILLCQVFASFFVLSSMLYTSSSKVMFLTKLEPYLVLLLGVLCFREKVTRTSILLLGVHFSGAFLLSFGGDASLGGSQFGDLLLIGGILLNATGYGFSARLAKIFGALRISVVTQIGSLLLFTPLLIFGTPLHEINPAHISLGASSLVINVLLYSVIATTTWFYALKGLPGWLVSALRALGPVLAAPVAWLMLGEHLNLTQSLGAAIIVTTSFGLVYERRSVRS